MRKVIGAINMTLYGYCDHDAITPGEELHEHYATLLENTGVALYGRITYELMTYWKGILENPTGVFSTDRFAIVMDNALKVVFSNTLHAVDWHSARLANHSLENEVNLLRSESVNPIYACSPSMINNWFKHNYWMNCNFTFIR
jgi:dihydrofolate reductase